MNESISIVAAASLLLALEAAGQESTPAALAAEQRDAKFVIAGQCIDRGEQTAVADVKIRLIAAAGLQRDLKEIASTISDAHGQFRFEGVEPPRDGRLDGLRYGLIAEPPGRPIEVAVVWDSQEAHMTRVYLAKESATLKGEVVDEQGKPITDARVRLYVGFDGIETTPVATTNDQGLFILRGLPAFVDRKGEPTAVSFVVTHPDYPTTLCGPQAAPGVARFTLKTGCRVSGVVRVAATGQPLAGRVVSALPAAASSGTEVNAVTDAEGRYQLNVHEGNYKVMLEDDFNFVAEAVPDLECRKGEHVELQPLLATAGGWLTGQVINTDTSQPIAFNPEGERIALGLYGPSRPAGRLLHQHRLAEVDDEGRFRMRAAAGENYPYFYNLRGARMAWDTKKLPPVIVVAGKETPCVMEFTPERTPEQKMEVANRILESLPEETDKRVEAIIEEFRKLNHTVDECEIWCLLMQELVSIGKPAVLPLCREFEATDQERMMRRLAFALRAIGDPRAVPTLIRVLPKMLQPPMSDYGLIVANNELAAFMRKHGMDSGRDRGQYFSFSRPVRETHGALNKLTKRAVDGSELFGMSRASDLRALARQEKYYHDTATEWARWWEANWENFDVDATFSQVSLPAYRPRDLSDYPTGLKLTKNATVDGGSSGAVLSPIGDPDREASFFLDLDTGSGPSWPAQIPNDSSPETVDAAKKWAATKGVDLICTAIPNPDGKPTYMLVGIGLKLWEIDPFDAKNIEKRVGVGKLPDGRPLAGKLLHFDAKSEKHVSQIGSSFLYVTREEGLGIITITDFVTEARDITGAFFAPRGVGFYRGVRFDHQPIAR